MPTVVSKLFSRQGTITDRQTDKATTLGSIIIDTIIKHIYHHKYQNNKSL